MFLDNLNADVTYMPPAKELTALFRCQARGMGSLRCGGEEIVMCVVGGKVQPWGRCFNS